MTTYSNIPTNIISGFLGAGKTTAIQYLLKQKPASETWAVIVNEFGKVGIDGALLKNDEVQIKEIPGGCLCCVGSQALSVGLNKIIRTLKPKRILIEPTGLGHPAKLVKTLTGEFYQSVLDLKAIINLVDARNLKDSRYTEHETFIDQSNMADILIASKLDTYSEEDKDNFYDYVASFTPDKLKAIMIEQGRLQLDWLDLPRLDTRVAQFPQSHVGQHEHNSQKNSELIENNKHWLMVEGHANGFYSVGWKLDNSIKFNQDKLMTFFEALFENKATERVKGILQLEKSWISINHTLTERNSRNCELGSHSVLEVISRDAVNAGEMDAVLKSFIH